MEMRPIEEMYAMLERNLPSGFMDKSEVDKRTVLESGWRKMVSDSASNVNQFLNLNFVKMASARRHTAATPSTWPCERLRVA